MYVWSKAQSLFYFLFIYLIYIYISFLGSYKFGYKEHGYDPHTSLVASFAPIFVQKLKLQNIFVLKV